MADAPAPVTAGAEDSGERVDRLLASRLGQLSRSRVKVLIEEGRVTADGVTITNPSFRVKPGQIFTLDVPPPVDDRPVPQSMALTILYEDAELVVLDKPAGLVVHPAPGNPDRTLVNALLAHCGDTLPGIGGVRRPGIVHRIDKDTSGLMVIAKTGHAHAALAAGFAARTIERAYWAAVWGLPSPREGEIDRPIGRSPTNRKKMAVVAAGKPARTLYRTLRPLGRAASGTHQRPRPGIGGRVAGLSAPGAACLASGVRPPGDRPASSLRNRAPRGSCRADECFGVAEIWTLPE
jgi:23S rRNA pseudouridine1911/1915/1917 synthase